MSIPSKSTDKTADQNNPYYFCQIFEYFIDLVNNTYISAFNDLNAKLDNILYTNLKPVIV